MDYKNDKLWSYYRRRHSPQQAARRHRYSSTRRSSAGIYAEGDIRWAFLNHVFRIPHVRLSVSLFGLLLMVSIMSIFRTLLGQSSFWIFQFRVFVSQFLAISVNCQFQWLCFNFNFTLHLDSIISIVTLSRRLDFWLLHRYTLIERWKTSTSYFTSST